MTRKAYPSDISREQFEAILEMLESAKKKTNRRRVVLYEIFCAILYLLREGCRWRALRRREFCEGCGRPAGVAQVRGHAKTLGGGALVLLAGEIPPAMVEKIMNGFLKMGQLPVGGALHAFLAKRHDVARRFLHAGTRETDDVYV